MIMRESRWITTPWETIHPPVYWKVPNTSAQACVRTGVDDGARRRDAHRRSLESSPRVRRTIRLERSCQRRRESLASSQHESIDRILMDYVQNPCRLNDYSKYMLLFLYIRSRSSTRIPREYVKPCESAEESKWKRMDVVRREQNNTMTGGTSPRWIVSIECPVI